LLTEHGLGVIVIALCSSPPADASFLDVMRANAGALRTALQSPAGS
jgi:hypothetical protein